MKIEILGASGAHSIPRPFCQCRACQEGRAKPYPPYVRTGPSVYIHDLNLLIDTPEESREQFLRSNLPPIEHVLYSHWHPDHTAGLRVFESNYRYEDIYHLIPCQHTTQVYLPPNVAATFAAQRGLAEQIAYLEGWRILARHDVALNMPFRLGNYAITPFQLAEDIACGYLFEGDKRFFICPDEINDWVPPDLGPLDLAILPIGVFQTNPITGQELISTNHPILHSEITWDKIEALLAHFHTKQVVFMHLFHLLTWGDYLILADRFNTTHAAPHIQFAYDQLLIEL